jgi:hemerythrin-like domain-containing protein
MTDSRVAQTVSDYLGSDHRRLDAMLDEFQQLLDARDLARAAGVFVEFARGLNRHIDAEEEVLFPEFEQRTGMVGGPTVVMRAEHVEIRDWMALVTARLGADDESGVRTALTNLVATLGEHNMKEEHVIYPMTDDAAAPIERDDIVRRMEAVESQK